MKILDKKQQLELIKAVRSYDNQFRMELRDGLKSLKLGQMLFLTPDEYEKFEYKTPIKRIASLSNSINRMAVKEGTFWSATYKEGLRLRASLYTNGVGFYFVED